MEALLRERHDRLSSAELSETMGPGFEHLTSAKMAYCKADARSSLCTALTQVWLEAVAAAQKRHR